MKLRSKILFAIFAFLLLIQLIPAEKNQAAVNQPNDIFSHYPASAEVQAITKKACYDCHSNNTKYPWYAPSLQPLAWWINHHVAEGKGELNFSEFAAYKVKKARHKLEEAAEQIEQHEMPLSSYTLIHKEAKLTEAEQRWLVDWFKSTRESIQVKD